MKVFSALLAFVVFAALELTARGEMVDAIKVIVHDSIVSSQQVEDDTAPFINDLRREFRNDPAGYQKRLLQLLEENTEMAVQRELILREFEAAAYNVPESVIDDYIQQRVKSRYGSRATLTKTLQAEGKTYEKFRKEVRDLFIVEQMRLKNVSEAILISPHKIEVFYVAHTNDFKIEDQVKLRMIVLTNNPAEDPGQTRKLAEEILAKINGGASFTEMASVYSQDSRRSQGGDWDWVEKSVLRKELADVAFSLKPGEKSGIIETPGAFYIMLVEDVRSAHIKPLSEVRDDIERTLLSRERDRLQKQWIDRLKKKTFVRYF
jgi:peptidyl-prolyl cis-trans isomerase SurA